MVHYNTAIERRAITYFQIKDFSKAKQDFELMAIELNTEISYVKSHYYIGKIYSKMDSINDAILHFEQVLKFDNQKYFAGNALYEMTKIHIKQKNFYQALFTLQRALDLKFNSQRLLLYKDFTEGVLYLIKRQFNKGVEILNKLLNTLNKVRHSDKKVMVPTAETLTYKSYVYRAYGHLFNGEYSQGNEDLENAKQLAKLEKASEYNLIVAKGILCMLNNKEYSLAHDLLDSAKVKFPENKDPYLLQSLNILTKNYDEQPNQWIDEAERRTTLFMAKKIVDEAIDNNCKLDSIIFYYRGLIHFYMHYFYEALLDFEMAIDKDDEPGANLYLARGRSFAWLSMLNEAIKDFSIAINLDENCTDAYLCRGKWSYLVGNNTQAFMDFQKLIVLDPKNPNVHIYAGNLLMTTGAYQDATKAYSNADVVSDTAEAAFHRARCFAALNKLDQSVKEMRKVVKMDKHEMLAYPDLDWLEILNNLAIDSPDFEVEESSERRVSTELSPSKSMNISKESDIPTSKKQMMLDVSLDRDVLELSIKAIDKLITISEESKLSDIKLSVDSQAKNEPKSMFK